MMMMLVLVASLAACVYVYRIHNLLVVPKSATLENNHDVTCPDCGVGGSCLVNRCICVNPKYTGTLCNQLNPNFNGHSIACLKKNDDRCMNIPKVGRLLAIDKNRTFVSQKCEMSWWSTTRGVPERNVQQAIAFDYFRSLPVNLGHVLEIGAGPYTKARLILEQANHRVIQSLTLVDPLLDDYLANPNITTSFTTEQLCIEKTCIPVTLYSTTAESFHPQQQKFDTILLVNTLEHAENAVDIMHNIYLILKKGGIFIFGEEYTSSFQLQVADLCHPIRILPRFLYDYLALFTGKQLLPPRTGMDIQGITHQGVQQSIYAIVQK
jgi:SAM-dependent methyltransferase